MGHFLFACAAEQGGAAKHFPLLSQVAVLSMHTATCKAERNWPLWGHTYALAYGGASLAVTMAEEGNCNTSMRGVDEEVLLTLDD